MKRFEKIFPLLIRKFSDELNIDVFENLDIARNCLEDNHYILTYLQIIQFIKNNLLINFRKQLYYN